MLSNNSFRESNVLEIIWSIPCEFMNQWECSQWKFDSAQLVCVCVSCRLLPSFHLRISTKSSGSIEYLMIHSIPREKQAARSVPAGTFCLRRNHGSSVPVFVSKIENPPADTHTSDACFHMEQLPVHVSISISLKAKSRRYLKHAFQYANGG